MLRGARPTTALPDVGELVCLRRLGSESVYRVCSYADRGLVGVEVVVAPGLPAGQRVRFTREAVKTMAGLASTARSPEPLHGAASRSLGVVAST